VRFLPFVLPLISAQAPQKGVLEITRIDLSKPGGLPAEVGRAAWPGV
jgi:hypothetical protein